MTVATDFVESLLAVARPAPMHANPLVAGIVAGTASRDVVRAYASAIASMALSFPRRIAAVLSLCDDDRVRASLLGNLLEEEGVSTFVAGDEVTLETPRSHARMARKFARAAGVADADVRVLPPTTWFAAALERGDWLGAFAYFAIGFEANVPPTFRMIVEPLVQHYGFTRDDLEFLVEHYDADERHGLEAAHLIARVAETADAQERAIVGARRGGSAWWAFHRAAAAHRPRG